MTPADIRRLTERVLIAEMWLHAYWPVLLAYEMLGNSYAEALVMLGERYFPFPDSCSLTIVLWALDLFDYNVARLIESGCIEGV